MLVSSAVSPSNKDRLASSIFQEIVPKSNNLDINEYFDFLGNYEEGRWVVEPGVVGSTLYNQSGVANKR